MYRISGACIEFNCVQTSEAFYVELNRSGSQIVRFKNEKCEKEMQITAIV